ncbi:MAG: FAD-dependent oxidoreductase [bacterium]
MKPTDERADAVVIGAGPAGLAAGIRLAQAGLSTVVQERHWLWGGLNSFYKLGGRTYDVGLHALTNAAPKSARKLPLPRVMRQLRIPLEALELGDQLGSCTVFPEVSLDFSNDFEQLANEVRVKFPTSSEAFDELARELAASPHDVRGGPVSTRQELLRRLRDELLVDLLLHPLLWYGSPTPNDMAWSLFVVLWKSIYEEGFARPRGGVRPLLKLLTRRLKAAGGTLRLRSGVQEVLHGNGQTEGVVLDDGTVVRAPLVLSSAGLVETLGMLGDDGQQHARKKSVGPMTFVESCTHLKQSAPSLGFNKTITFWNNSPRGIYAPSTPEPFDARSGVLCIPENYAGQDSEPEGILRMTVLSQAAAWEGLEESHYAMQKEAAYQASLAAVAQFAPDPSPHVVARDVFTPRTITHFTSKLGGAVYGVSAKVPHDAAKIAGLHIIGTDNGFLGIVGALVGGAGVAALAAAGAQPQGQGAAP